LRFRVSAGRSAYPWALHHKLEFLGIDRPCADIHSVGTSATSSGPYLASLLLSTRSPGVGLTTAIRSGKPKSGIERMSCQSGSPFLAWRHYRGCNSGWLFVGLCGPGCCSSMRSTGAAVVGCCSRLACAINGGLICFAQRPGGHISVPDGPQ